MKAFKLQFPMLPRAALHDFGNVAEQVIDSLLSQGRQLRALLDKHGDKNFSRATVSVTDKGFVFHDETGYGVCMEWWQNEVGREIFCCFAVKGGLKNRSTDKLRVFAMSKGLGTVPVCIDVFRHEGVWTKNEIGFSIDFLFPLPIWLDAMIKEASKW